MRISICEIVARGGRNSYINAFLTTVCITFNSFYSFLISIIIFISDTFQLDPDNIITEYLFKSDKFTLKLFQQFCTDFNLNVQTFLPIYLRDVLLNWKPDMETVKDPNLGIAATIESKCK